MSLSHFKVQLYTMSHHSDNKLLKPEWTLKPKEKWSEVLSDRVRRTPADGRAVKFKKHQEVNAGRSKSTSSGPNKVLPNIINQHIANAQSLILKKKSLLKQQREFEAKYVMVNKDEKDLKNELSPYQDSLKLIDVQLAALRSTVRSIMGPMKAYKITLVEEYFFASNGSGISASALTIDPSTLSEFSALLTLFDEFKVTGGKYEYTVNDWHIPSTTINACGSLSYDPSDGTAPTSMVQNAQKQQHTLVPYGTASAGLTSLTVTPKGMNSFEWHVPHGVLIAAGATASEGTSNWQPTSTVNGYIPYGWIKYYVSGKHNSVNQISGIVYHHCAFRSRE